jgi:hypothetical protein
VLLIARAGPSTANALMVGNYPDHQCHASYMSKILTRKTVVDFRKAVRCLTAKSINNFKCTRQGLSILFSEPRRLFWFGGIPQVLK